MKRPSYPILILPLPQADGGGFIAYAPDLDGCVGHGDTEEEALMHVREAIAEWIDEAEELQRPIPEPESYIARNKAERERVLKKLEEQKVAIDRFQADVETMREVLTGLASRLAERLEEPPSWQVIAAAHISTRRGGSRGEIH